MQLIIVKAFFGLFYELARPLAILFKWAQRLIPLRYRTRRQRRAAAEPPEMLYGHVLPALLLVTVICQVYAVIAPLVMPCGAVFFALLSFVAWQLIGKRRRERASVTAALPPASGLLQALSAAPAACLASLEAESDHEYVRMMG